MHKMDASRRVKRSSRSNYSLVPSGRKDDAVQAVNTSSSELGIPSSKLMHCRFVKSRETSLDVITAAKNDDTNLIRQPKSSSLQSIPEKEHLILDQKRAASDCGNRELKIPEGAENSFLFKESKLRRKIKGHERKESHSQSLIVAGPSSSNGSMMRQHCESSSKKFEEVDCICCGRVLRGKVDELVLNGASSNEVQSTHLHLELDHTTKKKAEVYLEDDTLMDMQDAGPTIESSRLFSLSAKGMVAIAEEQGSSASYPNSMCSKPHDLDVNMVNHLSRTHPIKNKEKIHSSSLRWRNRANTGDNHHLSSICKGPQITSQVHISNPTYGHTFSEPVSVSRRSCNWEKNVENEKKCKSPHPDFGELYSKFRCRKSHGQQSVFSDYSSSRVSQVESDEVFARELQEQFYHETTGFMDMEKADAKIARSLQNDEDAAFACQVQSSPSPCQPLSLFESHSSTHGHAVASVNLEYGERYPEMVMIEKYGRNLNVEVDLDTRLDLLEAVEDMLEINYMFDDYEESNDQHIASHDINSLPISVVQNDNNEEACSVCLEVPSVGEALRHLPCLHRFHKTCIDTWLKRKPSCPVCKFSVA